MGLRLVSLCPFPCLSFRLVLRVMISGPRARIVLISSLSSSGWGDRLNIFLGRGTAWVFDSGIEEAGGVVFVSALLLLLLLVLSAFPDWGREFEFGCEFECEDGNDGGDDGGDDGDEYEDEDAVEVEVKVDDEEGQNSGNGDRISGKEAVIYSSSFL